MGTSRLSETLSAVATSAIASSKQYTAVKGSKTAMVICDTAGENALGILQDESVAAGSSGLVAIGGRSLAKCEGTFSAGQKLCVSATSNKVGWLKAVSANTQHHIATALEACGADGDLVEVQIIKGGLNQYGAATPA